MRQTIWVLTKHVDDTNINLFMLWAAQYRHKLVSKFGRYQMRLDFNPYFLVIDRNKITIIILICVSREF